MELLTGPNLAALITLPGVGEKRATVLATHFQNWDNFLRATPDELHHLLGAKTGAQVAEEFPHQPLTPFLPSGTHATSRFDPEYPTRLHTLTDPPTLLWWQGTLPTEGPALAVVGTRTPNAFGAQVARYAATTAADQGIATVSGLALGCDSLGHTGSLDHHAPTWAVLGQGIDTRSTRGDRAELAHRILTGGGGILTEVPPGTPVKGHLLFNRNRLQSGLSDATFIAQTGLTTGTKAAGTLYTALFAVQQGRYLAVAVPPPGQRDDPVLAGNAALVSSTGLDPAELQATKPDVVALIRARKPFADLCVNNLDDLNRMCEHILEHPSNQELPNSQARGRLAVPETLGVQYEQPTLTFPT